MKAERRHELKQNTLVRGLEQAPSALTTYGPRLLLGVCIGMIIFMLVRYRMNAKVEQINQVASDLAEARADTQKLSYMVSRENPEIQANQRNTYFKLGDQHLDNVLKNADPNDGHTLAEALATRGDLNWTMANLPPLPGSATQPSLRPELSSDDLIKTAKQAYEEVLASHADQTLSVTTAHFGLAAIAENASDWDTARKQYQAVLDDKAADPVFQQIATVSLARVDKVSKPIFVAPTTLPSVAATQPEPTTAPAVH